MAAMTYSGGSPRKWPTWHCHSLCSIGSALAVERRRSPENYTTRELNTVDTYPASEAVSLGRVSSISPCMCSGSLDLLLCTKSPSPLASRLGTMPFGVKATAINGSTRGESPPLLTRAWHRHRLSSLVRFYLALRFPSRRNLCSLQRNMHTASCPPLQDFAPGRGCRCGCVGVGCHDARLSAPRNNEKFLG